MKKKVLFFFIISLLWSCREDYEIGRGFGNDHLQASIADESSTVRSVLVDNPTSQRVDVAWKPDDAIGLFGSKSGNNLRYSIDEKSISDNGKFAIFNTDGNEPQGILTAYFPYSKQASIMDGKLGLNMPFTQNYVLENGVVHPYSEANMMAAKIEEGKSNLVFYNLFALLRIGLTGAEGQTVKKTVFTDLTGKSVSGNFQVEWEGNIPSAVFPEAGDVNSRSIILDCGEGVKLSPTSITQFYMMVPPRNYTSGFRVEFQLSDGSKITKTIGASGGKILERGGLYPIGELFPQIGDIEFTLQKDVKILRQNSLDSIIGFQLNTSNNELTIKTLPGVLLGRGDILLINSSSAVLPAGYAGRIRGLVADDESGRSFLLDPVKELTDVFKELKMGGPIWNNDGTPIENAGIPMDLSSYIKEIRTINGQLVPFTRSGSTIKMQIPVNAGSASFKPTFETPFNPNTSPRKLNENAQISLTRRSSTFTPSFSTPAISHTFNEGEALTTTVEIQVDMNMYVSMNIHESTLEYLHFKSTPVIKLGSEFNAKVEKAIEKEISLLEFNFAPIPIGPILITPLMRLSAVADVKGEAELKAKIEYEKELPFGFSYQTGNFFYRSYFNKVETSKKENPLSLSGNFILAGSAAVGVKVYGGFKVYGILEATANLDSRIRAKAELNTDLSRAGDKALLDGSTYSDFSEAKFSVLLNPSVGVGVASLGGILHGKAQSEAINIPLWESYLLPKIKKVQFEQKEKSKLNVSVELTNNLLFDTKIGLRIYPNYFDTVINEFQLGNYITPAEGKESLLLNNTIDISNLKPGTSYACSITITVNGVTVATQKMYGFTTLWDTSNKITFTTPKAVGESFSIYGLNTEDQLPAWIDWNNNGIKEDGESGGGSGGGTATGTLGSQTVTIYGPVSTINLKGSALTTIDANRSQTLLSLRCFDNQLTSINVSGCNQLVYLYCYNNQLTSLDVNGCTALKTLSCSLNQISKLDVSSCTSLEELSCDRNKIISLNVSNLSKLTNLVCYTNLITALNTSNCTNLREINFGDNLNLSSLNISNCNSVTSFSYANGKLTSLDVSGCAELRDLSCNNNQLTSLKISNCPKLKNLACYYNQLGNLDVSKCPALTFLDCHNNVLTALDVSACTLLSQLDCNNNPLVSLDVSKCSQLDVLFCGNNIGGSNTTALMNSLPNRVNLYQGKMNFTGSGLYSDKDIAIGKNWSVAGGNWHW